MQLPASTPRTGLPGDSPPLGPEKTDRGDLAVRMARLFPNAFETLEVLRGVGLDMGQIQASGRPGALLGVWREAVAAAEAQGRLPALLDAARQRYGHERAIVAVDATESVRTFFLPLAVLGLSLGVAVALGSFLLSIDSRRWTRIDEMTPRFADLEVRAHYATVPPPDWAYWLAPPSSVAWWRTLDPGPTGAAPVVAQSARRLPEPPAALAHRQPPEPTDLLVTPRRAAEPVAVPDRATARRAVEPVALLDRTTRRRVAEPVATMDLAASRRASEPAADLAQPAVAGPFSAARTARAARLSTWTARLVAASPAAQAEETRPAALRSPPTAAPAPALRPGIPPFDAAALPTRPSLARPLITPR